MGENGKKEISFVNELNELNEKKENKKYCSLNSLNSLNSGMVQKWLIQSNTYAGMPDFTL